jgi:hypothetical protein
MTVLTKSLNENGEHGSIHVVRSLLQCDMNELHWGHLKQYDADTSRAALKVGRSSLHLY